MAPKATFRAQGRGHGRDRREVVPDVGCLLLTRCLFRKCADTQGPAVPVAATRDPDVP